MITISSPVPPYPVHSRYLIQLEKIAAPANVREQSFVRGEVSHVYM